RPHRRGAELMDRALQPTLAEIAIALSVFSLITYLWLGLTVLLIGNRRSRVTWVSGFGLLMAALFFLCHGALVGARVPQGASSVDFWWHLSWTPGFIAPICWAAIGLHYGGLAGGWRRRRLALLLAVATPGALAALLALVNLPVIGHYGDFIHILGSSLRIRGPVDQLPANTSATLPALGIAYIIYVAACASLPWAALAWSRRLPARPDPETTTAHDALFWDPVDAWNRARSALLGASLCMLGAGAVAALIGVFTSVSERNDLLGAVTPRFDLGVPPTLPGHVPLALVSADLVVQVCLSGLGLLLGWAVVRQGILVERRLPQRGFFSHWRGTALVASLLAVVVAGMAALDQGALPYLLVLVALVTAAYALFTRQSYEEHDRMLAQLRPFVASLSLGHAGWLPGDPREIERNVEALFTSLCRDVLGVSSGRLTVAAGRLHRSYTYQADPATIANGAGREWVLPISDERGVVAQIVLGPRLDSAGYTSADLEVARACGQRILDAVGEFAAAQAVVSLARQRGLEAELSAALPRRVLHDEVLPRLHLAMLKLEAIRGRATTAVAVPAGPGAVSLAVSEDESVQTELGEVVAALGKTHHDLAALMRSAPAANTRRLEHGLVAVLRSSLDGEFRGMFDALDWEAPPEACVAADALPPIVADLLLGASQEMIRNAGKHARGDDLHRRLTLRVALAADEAWVRVTVADDGVGLQREAVRDGNRGGSTVAGVSDSSGSIPVPMASTSTTRSGLLTYGALVGLVGGSLNVKSQPGAGTAITIRVPTGG
ncbi:MAG: sensor histidine kinase, partial [Ktedonobacterales bacterium]